MNNKGQSIFMGVIVGVMIFIAGATLLSFMSSETATFLGSTGLNCDGAGLTDGTKVACLIGELIVPYFIIIFVSLAGGVIAARFLL